MNDEDKECCRFVGRSSYSAYAFGGLVFAITVLRTRVRVSALGSRLAFKSRELAIYCGKQFIEIWINYLFK